MTSNIGSKTRTRPSRPTPSKSSLSRPRSYTDGTLVADMQLQHLKPSTELIAYYQQKMQQLNKENSEMQDRMEECMSLCDVSIQLEQELIQRNSEISTLQQAISDLQVYLYQEREQSLRLYAENDKLRIREIEDRKKIDLLLTLSGTSESELRIFLSNSEHGLCVRQKLPARLQNYKDRLNVISKEKYDCSKHDLRSSTCECPDDTDINLEAQMLASQLEEQIRLSKDHVHSLLKDRELTQKEHQVERDRLQSHISSLVSRLKLTQDKLCIATSDLLALQEDYRSHEAKWMEQKEKMRHKLDICKNELGESYPNELGYTISGRGSSSKRLLQSGDLSSLKEQLQEQDSLVTLYRNQSFLLEEELKKVKSHYENSKRLLKDRTQKLATQVTYLRSKYNELDRRRILEAEGFRNDIKMLRTRIQDMEKSFYKISRNLTPTQLSLASEKENQLLASAARDTLTKAQQLRRDLKFIKNKVHEIESDLKLNDP